MTDPDSIPSGSRAVIDSSVLFAMGGPDNEKYRAFLDELTDDLSR